MGDGPDARWDSAGAEANVPVMRAGGVQVAETNMPVMSQGPLRGQILPELRFQSGEAVA